MRTESVKRAMGGLALFEQHAMGALETMERNKSPRRLAKLPMLQVVISRRRFGSASDTQTAGDEDAPDR